MRTIAESPHFIDVEAALDNAKKGRGGAVIDQAWFITAILQAHAKYTDHAKYNTLASKTNNIKAAQKKAAALRSGLERLGVHFLYIGDMQRIERLLQNEIDRVTRAHIPYLTRSREAHELTKQQKMFCFWLAVWLVKRYPKKQFSTLIAALALCLFDDAERITGDRIKNMLKKAKKDIAKQADFKI